MKSGAALAQLRRELSDAQAHGAGLSASPILIGLDRPEFLSEEGERHRIS
jgi:hypothetical protein